MRVARKLVTQALFTLLNNSYDWVTSNPRLQLGDDLPADAQPAMFLVKPQENITQTATWLLPTYRLQYYALILIRASATPEDPGATAEDQMDEILDAIDNALMPVPGEAQTLGGLVTNCWINGNVQIDTPVLFEQCAIWIPISVITGV